MLQPLAILTYEEYISNFCENTFRKMAACRTEKHIIHVELYNASYANKLRGFEAKGTSSYCDMKRCDMILHDMI